MASQLETAQRLQDWYSKPADERLAINEALRQADKEKWEQTRLAKIAKANSDEPVIRRGLVRSELREVPKTEWMIDGLLPRNVVGVLAGRNSTFKTFLALDMALCIATGTPFHGREGGCSPVLFLAAEGDLEDLDDRITAWEEANEVTVDDEMFTVWSEAVDMFAPGKAFKELLEDVEERASLVVVDTLRAVSGEADENSSQMGRVINNLQRIKQATGGGSVIVIHHTTANDSKVRGATLIEDDTDVMLRTRLSEREDMILLVDRNRKGPRGLEVGFRPVPVGYSLVLEGGATITEPEGSREAAVDRADSATSEPTEATTSGRDTTPDLTVLDLLKPRAAKAIARNEHQQKMLAALISFDRPATVKETWARSGIDMTKAKQSTVYYAMEAMAKKGLVAKEQVKGEPEATYSVIKGVLR